MINGFVNRKITSQPIGVLYHFYPYNKVSIINHVFFMYNFTPHRLFFDILYPYPFNGVNIRMTAISENTLNIILAFHDTHKMIPRIMYLQHVLMFYIKLIAVIIINKSTIFHEGSPVLQIFHKSNIQRIVIVKICCKHTFCSHPRQNLFSENPCKIAPILRLYKNRYQLRADLFIVIYLTLEFFWS